MRRSPAVRLATLACTAAFQGWNPTDKSMLITARFGNTPQVHDVKVPGGARTQRSLDQPHVLATDPAEIDSIPDSE